MGKTQYEISRGSEIQTISVVICHRRQAECAKTARIQMALPPGGKAPAAAAPTANLYEELGDSSMWVNPDPTATITIGHLHQSALVQTASRGICLLYLHLFHME